MVVNVRRISVMKTEEGFGWRRLCWVWSKVDDEDGEGFVVLDGRRMISPFLIERGKGFVGDFC